MACMGWVSLRAAATGCVLATHTARPFRWSAVTCNHGKTQQKAEVCAAGLLEEEAAAAFIHLWPPLRLERPGT
jgi:hypothetical protein